MRSIQCIQWHVNCNYIATGSSDKTVRLWDVNTGECVRIFIGHRSMVLSLAMSPDGRYMASGDEDGTIMMWDLSNGRCVSPLTGHSSCIWTLAFRSVINYTSLFYAFYDYQTSSFQHKKGATKLMRIIIIWTSSHKVYETVWTNVFWFT